MSNQKIKVRSGGVGFTGLLAILFIGLKLGNIINWPWLWVLAPLWIPVAIILGVIILALFLTGVDRCITKM